MPQSEVRTDDLRLHYEKDGKVACDPTLTDVAMTTITTHVTCTECRLSTHSGQYRIALAALTQYLEARQEFDAQRKQFRETAQRTLAELRQLPSSEETAFMVDANRLLREYDVVLSEFDVRLLIL